MSTNTLSQQVYDFLVTRDFDPQIGKNEKTDAAQVISFEFHGGSGQNYGTVVIQLSDEKELDVYCSDNVGRSMESSDKTDWFQFLEDLKNLTVRNRYDFGIKNLAQLKHSLQGQAAIREGLFESWAGRRDVSWNANPDQSRLVIKHSRALAETEARHRCVESLFIETADGERYRLAFKNLTAGRAMLEHVRAGGRPWDLRGQHIAEMVTELAVLSRFRRANQGRLLEGDAAALVDQTNHYYTNLRRCLKNLTTRNGYQTYFESWQPEEISEQSVVIEGLKHLFVTQSIDQRIEDALPLLARIQQQENGMKEIEIFEAWATRLAEGTWTLPTTSEQKTQLRQLLSQPLSVGPDAVNATAELQELVGDDELFDLLGGLADRDPDANVWDDPAVMRRMWQLADASPELADALTQAGTPVGPEDNQLPAVSEADDSKEKQDLYGPEYQDMVARVGQKAKQQQELAKQGKEPQVRWNPKTKRYYVDNSGTVEETDMEESADLELARLRELLGR